jgi:WD40 repeat protein
MWMWLLAGLKRKRGILVGLAIVAILLMATSPLRWPHPRISWMEVSRAETEGSSASKVDEVQATDYQTKVVYSPDSRTILMAVSDGIMTRGLVNGRIHWLDLPEEPQDGSNQRRWLERAEFIDGGRLLVGILARTIPFEDPTRNLRVWEMPGGRVLLNVPDVDRSPEYPGYRVSADGSSLAYAMGRPGPLAVAVWRKSPDWRIPYFPGGSPLALSPDGRRLALFEMEESSGKLVIWNVEKSERLVSIPIESSNPPEAIEFSPDGKLLALTETGQTTLFETTSWKQLHVLDMALHGQPWFSPDGTLFFAGGRSSESDPTEIWNLAVNPPEPLYRGQVRAISPDGHRIVQDGKNLAGPATSVVKPTDDDPFQVVDLPSMRPGQQFEKDWIGIGHAWFLGNRASVEFGPDGRTFAISQDRTQKTWEQTLRSWLPGSVVPLNFSGRTWCEVKVEEIESGRILTQFSWDNQDRDFLGMRFLNDGRTLAIRSSAKEIEPNPTYQKTLLEFWDVPSPPTFTPVVLCLAALTLFLGGWYDRMTRLRIDSISKSPVT